MVQLLGAGLVFVALPLLTWGAYLTAKYVYGRLEGERPLLQKGPYRYIRHPIYLAFFLLGLGWILLALNVVGFALAVLFYDVRTLRREEHDLIETYGEEYVAYQRRTGMLLPRWPRTR